MRRQTSMRRLSMIQPEQKAGGGGGGGLYRRNVNTRQDKRTFRLQSFESVTEYMPMVDNMAAATASLSDKLYLVIVHANYGVDTFFVVGGMQVMYWTIKKLENGEGRTVSFWIHYYFDRMVRIVPIFGYSMLIFSSVISRRLNAPIYTLEGTAPNDCKSYWWSSLLFIHNFYPLEESEK
ncbi:PREDICTED: uncharacterized protein LOC106819035, partial [Priapulus caudatus]|uniref:Uncharacterized protein LOC106819035 n=1 Tax=Priapulus caudatus TaxID=37621 RepID=A0ABM1F410_PRICU